jgi:hypothetical protein
VPPTAVTSASRAPSRLTVTPGPGSDLSCLAGIALVISAFWHHHDCHVKRCCGTPAVGGTTFVVCRTHRTEGKPTHAHILRLHRKHRERQESGC